MNRVTRYTSMHRSFVISERVTDLQRGNYSCKFSREYEGLP
jgi:hypothetical protein